MTTKAANDAVTKLNGVQLDGRTLRVELSKPSAPRDGGGGSRSRGGFGGGRW